MVQQNGALAPSYEQINIAFRARFAARNGPDQSYLSRTVFGRNLDDRITVLADCVADGRISQVPASLYKSTAAALAHS